MARLAHDASLCNESQASYNIIWESDQSRMDVHLIDGTYELFRHFFAVPASSDVKGQEIGAVRGVLTSVLSMIERGATHLGVATDHVVESFRNDLYPGYKTSEGVARSCCRSFPILEEALQAMGVLVWPMVYFEADDALASAASKAAAGRPRRQVLICTPDKDLSQCVVGKRVVQFDRRQEIVRDEAGVVAKFGVQPKSIPDYLAVVGDSADGFPGLRDGVRRRRPSLSLSTLIWKTFRRIGKSGIHRSSGPARFPSLCSSRGMMRCCFVPWQPCGWMCQFLNRSRIFAGRDRVPTSTNVAGK